MYFGRSGQGYKKGNALFFMIWVRKLVFYLQVLISKVKVKLNNPPPPKKKTSAGYLESAASETKLFELPTVSAHSCQIIIILIIFA